MFHPRRRPRDVFPTVFVPRPRLLAHEQDIYRHVFVVALGDDPDALHAARTLAESLSDAVRRPAPRLYVASLLRTWAFFGDAEHLRHRAGEAWRSCPAGTVSHVVVSGHLLRGFVFARLAPHAGGVVFATAFDLAYRRFCASLTWAQWLQGMQAFLDVLVLGKGPRADASRALERMVARLSDLRVPAPGAFPEGLPVSDLERRFGRLPTLLWRLWAEGDAALETPLEEGGWGAAQEGAGVDVRATLGGLAGLPALRSYEERLYAPACATRSEDMEDYRAQPSLPLERLGAMVADTVFACVERIAALASPGERLGLKDFQLEVTFDAGEPLVRNVELAYAIFERTAHTEAIVARVGEGLPRGPAELPCAHEPSFHVYVHRVEGVRVVPTAIAHREEGTRSLFAEASAWSGEGSSPLCDVHERIRVKDKALPRTLGVSESLDPLASACEREPSSLGAPSGPEREETSPLFRYVHGTRPLQILKEPLSFRRGSLQGLALRFLEAVGEWDYFLGLAGRPDALLWLRAPRSERELPAPERCLTLMGVFESDAFFARAAAAHVLPT